MSDDKAESAFALSDLDSLAEEDAPDASNVAKKKPKNGSRSTSPVPPGDGTAAMAAATAVTKHKKRKDRSKSPAAPGETRMAVAAKKSTSSGSATASSSTSHVGMLTTNDRSNDSVAFASTTAPKNSPTLSTKPTTTTATVSTVTFMSTNTSLNEDDDEDDVVDLETTKERDTGINATALATNAANNLPTGLTGNELTLFNNKETEQLKQDDDGNNNDCSIRSDFQSNPNNEEDVGEDDEEDEDYYPSSDEDERFIKLLELVDEEDAYSEESRRERFEVDCDDYDDDDEDDEDPFSDEAVISLLDSDHDFFCHKPLDEIFPDECVDLENRAIVFTSDLCGYSEFLRQSVNFVCNKWEKGGHLPCDSHGFSCISPRAIHTFKFRLMYLLKLDSETMNRLLRVLEAWPLRELEMFCFRSDPRAALLVDSILRALLDNTSSNCLTHLISDVPPSHDVFTLLLQRKWMCLQQVTIFDPNDEIDEFSTNALEFVYYYHDDHTGEKSRTLCVDTPHEHSLLAIATLWQNPVVGLREFKCSIHSNTGREALLSCVQHLVSNCNTIRVLLLDNTDHDEDEMLLDALPLLRIVASNTSLVLLELRSFLIKGLREEEKPLPVNMTLERLILHKCHFNELSHTTLSHLKGLKRIAIQDIDRDLDWEDGGVDFLGDFLPRIMKTPVKPLVGLQLCYYSFDEIGTEALCALLEETRTCPEELKIAYIYGVVEEEQDFFFNYLLSMLTRDSKLRRLCFLYCDVDESYEKGTHLVNTEEVAENLVEFLRSNERMQAIETLAFDSSLSDSYKREIDFLLRFNAQGRYMLSQPGGVDSRLLPLILCRLDVLDEDNPAIQYCFVRHCAQDMVRYWSSTTTDLVVA